MAGTRTPFEDTSVPVNRSQEQIRTLLRGAGADGVQFTEEWTPATFSVRFTWPLADQKVTVKLTVQPLPDQHKGTTKSSEQRERQAWRGLAWYLEGQIKAATFGLIRFEDVFLSFIEIEPQGATIGERVIPRLLAGQPALEAGRS